ncbi:spore wall protein 2-like [Venturia canescens]|uniref:spore wall protein 2-like n=1 Tax=Venturia canescens TaxID=32260 RepID=UPI001C9D1A65|nr:spore wall protein 2-like [Venturia canescens]
MRQIARDLAVFVFLGAISCTLARPVRDAKSSNLRAQDDFDFRTILRDLLVDGNSPVESVNGKKLMKNASGKSDEGGYYKTYGSDAEGEKGFVKQTYSNGDHGYKSLDTFHKKAGDNYGFEKHTAFGKAKGADKGGEQAESGAYASKVKGDGDHEQAGTVVDTYYTEDDGDNAGYSEAEEAGGGDASGESASYTDGGDSENYTADGDGDAAHYTEGDSDSGNYGNSDGYNEHYSSGGGDEGSYGSHSSYASDGEAGYDGGEYY